jgi:hypothetical protein
MGAAFFATGSQEFWSRGWATTSPTNDIFFQRE